MICIISVIHIVASHMYHVLHFAHKKEENEGDMIFNVKIHNTREIYDHL